jgi:uncharacterized protein with HEPN domain
MKRPILLRLHDMLEAIETADEIIGTTTFAQFDRDRVKRFAVERCIEIVSEASRHIPETAKQDFPEIPWREIAAVEICSGMIIAGSTTGFFGASRRSLWRSSSRCSFS